MYKLTTLADCLLSMGFGFTLAFVMAICFVLLFNYFKTKDK